MKHDVNRVISESKVLVVSALCFLPRFDTVGLVTGTGIRHVKRTRVTYPPKVLFQNWWSKKVKAEPADPG